MKIYLFLMLFVILTACQPSPEQLATPVQQTISAISTATAYPTYTVAPSQTAYPTATPLPTYTIYPTYTLPPTQTPQIIIVTLTSTVTPLYTPTITLTPTNTVPPTKTPDPLQVKHGPGFYLVGDTIAPGLWKNDGTAPNCYWKITTKTGDIIKNFFGMGGGTMYIPKTAFQVELHAECGDWTYMGE